MNKIKILDENKENLLKKDLKNKKRISENIKKINDNLLEIGLRKGLIEKHSDGFYFIGNYEMFLDFKNKGTIN